MTEHVLPDAAAIAHAAQRLEQGGLVAFPTETVYGLGADAENPEAIARIYAAKGRPANHPLIVHLASEARLEHWAEQIPLAARQLVAAFWPGPLTLIMPRAAHIPDAVAGGQATIGLRSPAHPVAQALLRQFKAGQGGIAAPSANRFGHVSPTTALHVYDEFAHLKDDLVPIILDGGPSIVGIESTILDLSRMDSHGPVLLRPGQIGVEAIAAVIGMLPCLPDAAAPRASGTLAAHYAPRTPVALVAVEQLTAVLRTLHAARRSVALLHREGMPCDWPPVIETVTLPHEPAGYARGLYAGLRALDAVGAEVIVVTGLPPSAAWQAVNDRLRRAAHDSAGILQRLVIKGDSS